MAELKLTKDNFNSEVLESDIPVLIDFWATWCGPCQMMAPVIEELAKDYDDKVKVGKINVDEEPYLSAQYQITSIPTIMIFVGGQVKKIAIGYRPKEDLEFMLKETL